MHLHLHGGPHNDTVIDVPPGTAFIAYPQHGANLTCRYIPDWRAETAVHDPAYDVAAPTVIRP